MTNIIDIEVLSEAAVNSARAAGKMIQQFKNRKVKIMTKNAGSTRASQVLTEVDLQSQKIILAQLEQYCRKYDLALLSEEKEDDLLRLEKEYFWAIDPMDGTLAFIEEEKGFAVSIGLVAKNGKPVLGVVYDPVTENLYQSVSGQGAFKNGQPLRISGSGTKSVCHLIADKGSAERNDFQDCLTAFSTRAKLIGYKEVKLIVNPGAVMNVCWAIEKAPACYFKLPKTKQGGGCIWDFAAVACLFSEAGGIVSDALGNSLPLNEPDTYYMNRHGAVFASDKFLQKIILELANEFAPVGL